MRTRETYLSSTLKIGSTSDILPPIGSDILHLCSCTVFVSGSVSKLSVTGLLKIDSIPGPSASPLVDGVSTDLSFSFLPFSAFPCFLFFFRVDSSLSVLSRFLFSNDPLLACDCDLEDAISSVK